ncbi:hypothetical protein C8N32_12051 [Rhodovulum imhoffii]|uniref:Excinuclease ABC subunit B n=1 Tax=Rhodovulum imhoffii TaxID=365340 RepID=A0A2T5BPG3_9RHOB|nr:hypothetical protein [Rhodovulum imhoffii]MBK5932616.1 hypothetical protein [Rhodovulum imhoffii]PTN00930.1 hypothetical protein C8N32_12051 [Rhodovulum imhoffii]
MTRLALLGLILALAACATPRQACDRDAVRDLTIMDRLIVESELTLQRGYGLQRETYATPRLRMCYGNSWHRHRHRHHRYATFCNSTELRTRLRPVAVDLSAERRKLREMKLKRAELAQRSVRALDQCKALYPVSAPAR